MSESFDLTVFAIVIVGWVFSLCLHEFSHALVAYWGGDFTVRDKGYLTFNPLRYTDPVSSIFFPLLFLLIGGIGMPGGAVYIETWRLRSRHWDCAVSLAGPAANIVFLGLLIIPFQLGLVDEWNPGPFWTAYAFLCYLQVMAILFNLLPVPPLDGFGAISAYMKTSVRAWFHRQSIIFLLALFVVFFRVDSVHQFFWSTLTDISEAIGVPVGIAMEGFRKVRPFAF